MDISNEEMHRYHVVDIGEIMKNTEEILRRAVLLLCLSDRSAMEEECINGVAYSLIERENQRKSILSWIQQKGYYAFATEEEKSAFTEPVNGTRADDIMIMQIQYEALQPCLWALGLVDKLSGYAHFVINDYHPTLHISKDHSFEELLLRCKVKSKKEIDFQVEVAALWHWRMREYNNHSFANKDIHEVIRSVFGDKYLSILDYILEQQKLTPGLFEKGTTNNISSDNGPIALMERARWRHHAFQWIKDSETWDEVELDT